MEIRLLKPEEAIAYNKISAASFIWKFDKDVDDKVEIPVLGAFQDGKLIAKRTGKTDVNIYALVGERVVSRSYNVKVYDVTPLDKATISGESTVEAGFKITLSASATHESGSTADMTDCTVKFELCDLAMADILTVTENGVVTGVAEGTASVKTTVTARRARAFRTRI